MEAIQIAVTGTMAVVTGAPKLASGTAGLPVEFKFDKSWNGLAKSYSFKAGGKPVTKIADGNTTTVPAEVMAKAGPELMIGVTGTGSGGKLVVPTLWAVVDHIYEGAVVGDEASQDPTLPVWQQILEALDKKLQKPEKATEGQVLTVTKTDEDGRVLETGATDPGDYYTPEIKDGFLSFTPSRADMPAVPEADVRGPQGPEGPQGPQGPEGPQGPSGVDSVYTINYHEGLLWGEEGFDYAAARAAFDAGKLVVFNYTRIAMTGSERYICTKNMRGDEAYGCDGLLFLGASYGNPTELRLYPDGTIDINILADTYDLEVRQDVLESQMDALPFQSLTGTASAPIVLRKLDSGVYLLNGKIKMFGSGSVATAVNDFYLVSNNGTKSHVIKFATSLHAVHQYILTDTSSTFNQCRLNLILDRLDNIEARLAAYGI